MAEQLANLGYAAIKKETTAGTAVTPNVYVPLYSEDMKTDVKLDEDNPVVGHKFERHQAFLGVRAHAGTVEVLAEPNTAAHWFNMLLWKGTTTGGTDPYTHPFTLVEADSQSYTLDIAVGNHVKRFIGVKASSIKPAFNENKMHFEVALSALKSFQTRTIASVSGIGPYTISFDDDYDPSPTTGLVVGDLIQVYDVSEGTYINAIVDTIEDATDITVSEDVSAGAAGDIVSLRPGTPSYSVLTPFLWSRSEFRFADTAANALSATHTPLESGSEWEIMHNFEEDEGSKRSGSFDPAALPRTQGNAALSLKKFFDDPQELNRFLTLGDRALVIRHFSGTGHELRLTFNKVHIAEDGDPVLSTGEIIYQEYTGSPVYKTADSQAIAVTVINALSSI